MKPRSHLVALFGGNNKQIEQVSQLCPDQFELCVLPTSVKPSSLGPEFKPSIVAIVVSMEDKNALALIRKIRRRFFNFPVLAIAEKPNQTVIIEAFRSGIDDLILLPNQKDQFHRVFQSLLGKIETQQFSTFSRIKGLGQRIKQLFTPPKMPLPESTMGIVAPPALSLLESTMGEGAKSFDFHVRFLGDFELRSSGKSWKKLPGKKQQSLLAYLIYHHGKTIHRETLMNEFWGENSPSSARNSLNVAVHSLRKYFERHFPQQEVILYKNECYSIDPGLDITTDVHQFLDYWQKGKLIEASQGLESALGAYNKAKGLFRGDFLEKIKFDEWVDRERDNLKEIYLSILERLSVYFFQQASYTVCLNLCKQILEADACQENIHRQAMIAYYRLGHRDKAIKQYQKCELAMEEGLKLKPSKQTFELFIKISNQDL